MLTRRLNELRVDLELSPASPLLIKEGRHLEGDDRERRYFNRGPVDRVPAKPQRRESRDTGDYDSAEGAIPMVCVYSTTRDGDRYYLPGSSLRGLLRSAAERLIGRWQPGWVRESDPFRNLGGAADEERERDESPGPSVYAAAGPIERCFGHTGLRGRWVFADAWIAEGPPARAVVRDGVGISRSTGAAQQNVKFQYEAITAGRFRTTLTLVNYELWQLGLLAHLLAGLDAGETRLGYGTRRGLGQVRVAVRELRWRWYGHLPPSDGGATSVPSLAALAARAKLEGYGWRDEGLRLPLPAPASAGPLGGEAALSPPRLAPDPEGFAATDWDAPPWPAMAELLPAALAAWPPEEKRR